MCFKEHSLFSVCGCRLREGELRLCPSGHKDNGCPFSVVNTWKRSSEELCPYHRWLIKKLKPLDNSRRGNRKWRGPRQACNYYPIFKNPHYNPKFWKKYPHLRERSEVGLAYLMKNPHMSVNVAKLEAKNGDLRRQMRFENWEPKSPREPQEINGYLADDDTDYEDDAEDVSSFSSQSDGEDDRGGKRRCFGLDLTPKRTTSAARKNGAAALVEWVMTGRWHTGPKCNDVVKPGQDGISRPIRRAMYRNHAHDDVFLVADAFHSEQERRGYFVEPRQLMWSYWHGKDLHFKSDIEEKVQSEDDEEAESEEDAEVEAEEDEEVESEEDEDV